MGECVGESARYCREDVGGRPSRAGPEWANVDLTTSGGDRLSGFLGGDHVGTGAGWNEGLDGEFDREPVARR